MQPKDLDDGKTGRGTQRAQLTRLVLKLEREEQSMTEPKTLVAGDAPPYTATENKHGKNSVRAILYGALALSLLFSITLTWMLRDLKPTEVPSWKAVLALAEVAQEKGDLYDAKALYSQAGGLAAWNDDWAGLLATACGLDKLEKKPSRYSARDALLLRAMAAAEKKQSRAGMTAVAQAFTSLGKHEPASMALSRIRNNWPAEQNDSGNVIRSDCWADVPDHILDLTGE